MVYSICCWTVEGHRLTLLSIAVVTERNNVSLIMDIQDASAEEHPH